MIQALLEPTPYRIHRRDGPRVVRDAFDDQRRLVGADPVVFDVGANEGRVAQRYLDRCPDATVHAFEPFPPLFDRLAARADGEPRLTAHQLAVSDHEGTATLHCNDSAATNSLLASRRIADDDWPAHWPASLYRTTGTVEVPTTTIDTFCAEHSIDHIDVLKLDIQGGELAALRGARTLVDAGRVDLIYLELITAPTYTDQPRYHEVMAFLDGLGYVLYDLYHPVHRGGPVLQFDGLFISPAAHRRLSDRGAR